MVINVTRSVTIFLPDSLSFYHCHNFENTSVKCSNWYFKNLESLNIHWFSKMTVGCIFCNLLTDSQFVEGLKPPFSKNNPPFWVTPISENSRSPVHSTWWKYSTSWKFSLHFVYIFRTSWNSLILFCSSNPSYKRNILR